MEEQADNLKIRKLGHEDLEEFNALLRYAFQVTEEDLLKVGWEDDEIRQSKSPILEKANVLGVFDGDRLAAQIAVYPMAINIHGNKCSMGFVTGVATYPEYSGMGMMSRLMKQCLTQMRENGQIISLLYPYSIPLYRNKGWDIISDKMTFSVKDYQLPGPFDVPGRVRRVEDTSDDLIRLHDAFTGRTHGCIWRNNLAWEEYWRWDSDDINVAVYYSEEEKPLGYMVYMLSNDIMHVKEMVYLTQEAYKGLWSYINAHESMVTEVKGNNYTSMPLAFWLDDSEIRETIRPYIMGRIIDVHMFLEQYRFLEPTGPVHITFDVKDHLLEWNNRCFTVSLAPGKEPEISCQESAQKVTLSIGTLTTLLMGYREASYLKEIGHLTGDDHVVKLLGQIIPREKPYISDYI